MTTTVNRYDFRKNTGKWMKKAETETVIILRAKLSGWDDGTVLISWQQYTDLLEKKTGVKL